MFEKALETETKFTVLSEAWRKECDFDLKANDSSHWRYVKYCLRGLVLLQKSLENSVEEFEKGSEHADKLSGPSMPADTLSFAEQKVVKRVVQFVVSLGICTNLEPGVGLPVELRTEFSDLLKLQQCEDGLTGELQLFYCVKVLVCCVNCPPLSTMILHHHFVDILAALLQLNHNGQVKHTRMDRSEMQKSAEGDDTKHESLENSTGTGTMDYVYCKYALDELVKKVYPPLLVNTLLLLQGGPKPKVILLYR